MKGRKRSSTGRDGEGGVLLERSRTSFTLSQSVLVSEEVTVPAENFLYGWRDISAYGEMGFSECLFGSSEP